MIALLSYIELFSAKTSIKFNFKELNFKKNFLVACLQHLYSCFEFHSILQLHTCHAFEILYDYMRCFTLMFQLMFITYLSKFFSGYAPVDKSHVSTLTFQIKFCAWKMLAKFKFGDLIVNMLHNMSSCIYLHACFLLSRFPVLCPFVVIELLIHQFFLGVETLSLNTVYKRLIHATTNVISMYIIPPSIDRKA